MCVGRGSRLRRGFRRADGPDGGPGRRAGRWLRRRSARGELSEERLGRAARMRSAAVIARSSMAATRAGAWPRWRVLTKDSLENREFFGEGVQVVVQMVIQS